MDFSPAIRNAWKATYTLPVDTREITPDAIRDNLYIMDKNAAVIPFVPNKAQLHFRAHKTGRDLILKARQQGFSTEIQGSHFVDAITSTALCATLAHDADTTAKLRRMAARFYDHLPATMRPERGLDNATTTTYPATGSEVTIATAGSGNVGRGGTYTKVHGSEVAFWNHPQAIMAGIMQGVTPDGEIVLESTANGAQDYFYEKCMEALRGEGIWTLHFYAWWWSDEYALPLDPDERLVYDPEETELARLHNLSPEQIKWRRYKIAEIGDLFQQEYPEDPVTCFLTSGRGVFQLNKPDLFTDYTEDRSIIGYPVWLLDGYVPDDKSVHVAAIDWGQAPESTALSIMDSTTYQEIALYVTGKRDYEYIIEDMVALIQHFNVQYVVPEKNSMRMQVSVLGKRLKEAMPDNAPRVSPFNMDSKRKDDLVKLMQQGMNSGLRLLDVPMAKHEIRIFEARQNTSGSWSYSHPDGGTDDTVIARMLSHLACFQLRERYS